MFSLEKNGAANTVIVAENTRVALFAAEELHKYIKRISGCHIPIVGEMAEGKSSILIGTLGWYRINVDFDISSKTGELVSRQTNCNRTADTSYGFPALKYDWFSIREIGGNLILTAEIERGLMYAVYELLERIGCRWFLHGEVGEYVPSLKEICLDNMDILEVPDFEIRNIMEEGYFDWFRDGHDVNVWLEEAAEVIDWSCKNRLNSFDWLLHHFVLGELPAARRIIDELKKRGMLFAIGGHCTHDFVDRSLFYEKPYFFIEKNGVRVNKGNVCSSNNEVNSLMQKSTEGILSRFPEIDILHIWFEDTFEGSWCECEKCRKITVQQQQMNLVSAIADGIRERYPNVRVDMLLYHDTLEMNKITGQPGPNLLGMYAARERCYAHSLGNWSCRRNRENFKNLKDTIERFGDNVFVFEYYADMILYTKMKINHPSIIVQDLKEYKEAGVKKISNLMYLHYSRWAYPFVLYTFARASWNTGFDYRAGLKEFCGRLYPGHSEIMFKYYEQLEETALNILTFCEYEGFFNDLRNVPSIPADFNYRHMERIKAGIGSLNEYATEFGKIIEEETGPERQKYMNKKTILDITINEMNAIYCQQLGSYLSGFQPEITAACFDKAIEYKNRNRTLIDTVPTEVKGVCGHGLFVKHLCGDQIAMLEDLNLKVKIKDGGAKNVQ